ncbi:MAG: hypothetical protein J5741_07330 [Bacteroidales bacterium]|nr:hypothetical protein [Bacteroidales bacterium]
MQLLQPYRMSVFPSAHLRRAILPVRPYCYQPLQTYGLHRAHHARAIPLNF